jgi:hypothetical protein
MFKIAHPHSINASGGQGLFLKKLPLSVKHPQKLFIKSM